MAMYWFRDFVRGGQVIITPKIENLAFQPFTMAHAMRFFAEFERESFTFDGEVETILIYGGKENLPRHSFVNAWLYSQSVSELKGSAKLPQPVGSLDMGCGGNDPLPFVSVKKWGEL